MKRIITGFRAALNGLNITLKSKKIMLLSLGPCVLQLILFSVGIALLVNNLGSWLETFVAFLPLQVEDTANAGFFLIVWNKILLGIIFILKALLALLIATLMFFLLYLFGSLLSSPIYDLLSEATEKYLYPDRHLQNQNSLVRSIFIALRVELQKVLVLSAIPILGLVLGLIPAVGVVLTLILINIYAPIAFAFNFVDYTMGRKDLSLKQRLSFVRRFLPEMFGFGLVFFIPLVNFLGAPIFVVGGTALYYQVNSTNKII